MCKMYDTVESLCLKRGITVGKMCSELNISRGTMGDLKAGRTEKLSTKNLEKISSYFKVSVGYLIGEEKPTIQMNDELKDVVETCVERPDMQAIFHSMRELTTEEVDAVLQVIKLMKHKE